MKAANHVLAGRRTAVQSCLQWAFYVFLALGLLAAGYAGYIIADAQVYQAIQLRKFPHDVPILEPHSPGIGERVGEIEIPRLKLKVVILQGDSPQVLRRGIGHLPNTAMPGELGNVGLAGHRDSFFRPLRQIRVGDLITLRTSKGEFHYQVESTFIVSPESTQVLDSSERSELTLVTCYPFNFVGAAPDRFVVRAVQFRVGRAGFFGEIVNVHPSERQRRSAVLQPCVRGQIALLDIPNCEPDAGWSGPSSDSRRSRRL